MSRTTERPSAVVVGLCAHGLGIVRALHHAGVAVLALEANPNLPGVRTRCADVRIVPDINGEGLVAVLSQFPVVAPPGEKPVLLLTNDRMVEVVGRHAEEIDRRFRLSWAHAAERLLPLLGKDQIEARCAAVGLNYPKSLLLADFTAAQQQLASLTFPVIAKPTRPVSAFKTQVADSPHAFLAARARIEQAMPVIVQEFVPGDDTHICFGALYLDRGRVLARFEGRKLRSRPMGHTTIAVPKADDEVHALACRFFEGLQLSGPVSLELKRDPAGRYWVIEPTVGRTDFWAGLCAANGIDLSHIEYDAATGTAIPPLRQRSNHLWINGERDPGALAWLLRHAPLQLLRHRWRGVYLDFADPRPFLVALGRFLTALPQRALRKTSTVMARKA